MKTQIRPGVFEELGEEFIECKIDYVNIPRDILVDKKLKCSEKIIMGMIISFMTNDRQAFPSNKLLGMMCSLSASRISAIVNSLAKRRFLDITLVKNERGHTIKRYLTPSLRYKNSFSFTDD